MALLYVTGDELAARGECGLTAGTEADSLAEAASSIIYGVLGGCLVPETTVKVRPRHVWESFDPLRVPTRSAFYSYAGIGPSPWVGPFGYDGGLGMCDDSGIGLQHPAVVDAIKVDGALLASSAYRCDGFQVRRVDGHAWPTQQDLSLADTEVNTFSILYTFGVVIPELVKLAAIDVGVELYRQTANGAPLQKVVNRSTQGVTSVYENSDTERASGPQVQRLMWAQAIYNPLGQRATAWSWSPDDRWELVLDPS